MLRVALLLSAVILPASPAAADELPESLDFTAIRELVVQYDGRWPPLDTVARQAVETVTGDENFRGHDPVLLFLAWTFSPNQWASEPLIAIKNAELRAELQLSSSKTVYSYADLVSHRHLLDLINHLAHAGQGSKLDPLESKVSDINSKLVLLQTVFNGELLRPVPDADDPSGRWTAIPPEAMGGASAVASAWDTLREAFLSDDAAAFTAASKDLKAALATLPAATRPSPTLIATELRYNRLNPFRSGWMAMMVGAVLAAMGMLVRKRWFDLLGVIVIAVAFGIITYGLSLRWQIAGRIPASNMYESLLFLSWGAGAFAIVIAVILRHRFAVLTAAGMAAVSLMLADVLPMDPHIRPTVPVLMDTVWMSIHVPIIMV
ncbi:MAG: hypothetical protein KJ749_13290, partial [Planctomycetes bacterium]|nr:hypothetical protein [Planctomycetota bacterium]